MSWDADWLTFEKSSKTCGQLIDVQPNSTDVLRYSLAFYHIFDENEIKFKLHNLSLKFDHIA